MYAGLGCPRYWCLITDDNLIIHSSETFVHTSKFKSLLLTRPSPSKRLSRSGKPILIENHQTRFEGAKGVWPDELSGVLWAYRTTIRTPTEETPFKLVYGSEAIIPTEVHMANHRVMTYQDKDNEEQLRLNLDLIDEVRTDAEHKTTRYKYLMARQYDALVKPRHFNIGDLVMKKVSLATKNPTHGKFGPNWEEPYRVINCKRQGSYYFEALGGRKLEHPWNVEHLRKYYQ